MTGSDKLRGGVPTENSKRLVPVALQPVRQYASCTPVLAFVAVVAALRSTVRSRLELTAEILALRHKLVVPRRRAPARLSLRRIDRLVWVGLSRVWTSWRGAVQIGSIRRECLDHVIIWNECALRRHLRDDFAYDRQWRTHLSLDQDAPLGRAAEAPSERPIVAVPHVGSLHHHYERLAASGNPPVNSRIRPVLLGFPACCAELPGVVELKGQEKGNAVAGGSEV